MEQIGMSQAIKKKFRYKILNKKYKIGCFLTSGSFGNIFYGQDLNGNPQAIKITDLSEIEKTNDERLKRMIYQQPQAMKACDNDYVMKYNAVYQSTSERVIVMDYCQYGSLQDLIYMRVKIPQPEAKLILKQMLYALGDFHRHGRIHRDIKSANFCGKRKKFMLCDFGCSKIFLESGEQKYWRKTLRKDGTIVGTIYSKSPEMLAGQNYGVKTDLWGVGLIYYELLTGITPFDFRGQLKMQKVIQKIKNQIKNIFNPNYISKRLKETGYEIDPQFCKLSEEAITFLQGMLKIDQEQRMGWKNLLYNEYLIETVQERINNYEKEECQLPLDNIDWMKVAEQYGEQMEQNDYEALAKQYSIKTYPEIDLESIKEVDKKRKLDHNFNLSYEQFLQTMLRFRQIHFQMRRIYLLIAARTELYKFDRNKNELGLAISTYCLLKLKTIQEQNSPQQFQAFKLGQFLDHIVKPLRDIDKQLLEPKNNWIKWFFRIKNMFVSKELYQSRRILTEGNQLETIIKITCSYIEKANNFSEERKIALNKQCPNLKELFLEPKKILSCQYKLQKEYELSKQGRWNRQLWKKWKTLKKMKKICQFQIPQEQKELIK